MEQKYTRTKNVIHDVDGNVVYTGAVPGTEGRDNPTPSINAAKRESRRLQGSALGHGLLRVA